MTLPPHQLYRSKLFLGSSHSWALGRIANLNRELNVLDIGSGSGVMGRELKSLGFKNIYAIEPSADARTATQMHYSAMVDSLEKLDFSKKYDLILLLDVIEHMTDPAAFLNALLPSINSGATVLISVPNVTHWAIRLMVLFGRFEYMERGPLDKTHYRFFTKRALTALIKEIPGMSTSSLNGSIVPLELMLPNVACNNFLFSAFSKVRMAFANSLPSLFAYQLLAEVRYG